MFNKNINKVKQKQEKCYICLKKSGKKLNSIYFAAFLNLSIRNYSC